MDAVRAWPDIGAYGLEFITASHASRRIPDGPGAGCRQQDRMGGVAPWTIQANGIPTAAGPRSARLFLSRRWPPCCESTQGLIVSRAASGADSLSTMATAAATASTGSGSMAAIRLSCGRRRRSRCSDRPEPSRRSFIGEYVTAAPGALAGASSGTASFVSSTLSAIQSESLSRSSSPQPRPVGAPRNRSRSTPNPVADRRRR